MQQPGNVVEGLLAAACWPRQGFPLLYLKGKVHHFFQTSAWIHCYDVDSRSKWLRVEVLRSQETWRVRIAHSGGEWNQTSNSENSHTESYANTFYEGHIHNPL